MCLSSLDASDMRHAHTKVVLPGGMLLPPAEVRFSVVGIWDEDLQEAGGKTKVEW